MDAVTHFSTRDAARILQATEPRVRTWARMGGVVPEAGPDGRLEFTFQQLLLLRTTRGLLEAGIPASRVRRIWISLRKQLTPGARVEVIQQIPHRDRTWTNTIRGTILNYQQRQTGSWYAHAKDDKLWLDRLQIQKEDGEVTILNLDEYSQVTVLAPPTQGAEPTTAAVTGEMGIK